MYISYMLYICIYIYIYMYIIYVYIHVYITYISYRVWGIGYRVFKAMSKISKFP